jgi:protoheme IX farnesyltransferase
MPLDHTRRRAAVDFFALTKPRVVLMVLITTAIGFYLGVQDTPDYLVLLHTLIGTALAGGGTLALNQYMEREADGKMQRTRLRPLPDGRLQAQDALIFGLFITLGGIAYLWWVVSGLSALVTATITVSYLLAYTPLKQRTSLCSIVGAVPGALPPVIGWAAARDTVGLEAWILFAIMFLWQMPHSLAIGWLYRDDYAKAGFRLLPVIDPDGRVTGQQIVLNCAALLAVGLLPTLIGFAGATYFFAALLLGSVFLWYGLRLATLRSLASARHLLFASLVYLPVLLAILAFDKVTFPYIDMAHWSAHAAATHDHHADHAGHPTPAK